MSITRRLLSTVAVATLAAAALAPGFPTTAFAADEIVIGAILPLTGPAAPIGIEEQQGVQFAVDRANAAGGVDGRQIRVVFEDSQGKPDQAVLAFNRMVDLHEVPAILTAFSSVSIAIAPLATRKEVLVVNPAAQTDKLENASPYLINTIPLVKDEAAVLVKFVEGKLGKNAAIIYENAAAGIDGRDDFKKPFEAAGGTIVAEEPVEFGQTNYRATLLKVAAAKPDFVYIAITQGHDAFADQVGQVAGFPIAVGNTFSRPFFGHASTKGWYQTAIQSGAAPETEEAFKKQFGTKDMGFFAREYSNSTDIILAAAKHVLDAGGTLSGTSLRDAIFEIKDFKSPVAEISFTSNTAKRPVEIQQYTDTGRETIEVGTAN